MRRRFDNLPMHRRASADGASPMADQGALYERREVEPNSEEISRRLGTERQAQYAQALGLCAEAKGSFFAYDTTLNLSGDWSLGLSVNVGDVAEDSGEWTIVFAGRTAEADTNNSFRCYLKRDGADYKVHLDFIDNVGSAAESPTAVTVTPGDDVDILITKSSTTVTLNVDATANAKVLANTYNLALIQPQFGGTHKITTRPKGDAPVIDNIQFWASVVTTSVYQDRTPTGSPALSVLPSEIGGYIFEPATSGGVFLAHPAPPQIHDSKLYFSGYGGAVRVPFRSVFERYFQTATEIAQSQKFAFRVAGRKRFLNDLTGAEKVLIDFGSNVEGFVYVYVNASGNVVYEYNGTTVTSTGTISTNADFDLIVGCDGTNLYLNLDGTEDTATAPEAPYLDYSRIPDLYIGNDEDPAADKAFHGWLTTFEFYDYAFREDTAAPTTPTFALDFSGDYLRDKSRNRIAVAPIAHATTDGAPFYAPGPLTDQSFVGVEAGVLCGPGAQGYTGQYKAPISTDVSGVRAGDKAFLHSGDEVHVCDSELSQVRPLGLPEPEAEVSVRSLATGALDGAYDYGLRWVSQDGTYGPVKRLKPVQATGQSSVLIGAGTIDGGEERRELGESYGLAESGAAEHFSLTDSGGGIAATSDGHSVETYAKFPDFDELEENISDRGMTRNFSDEPTLSVEADQPVEINPNGDFTLQFCFRLSTTATSTETYEHQSLVAIGHEDPGPTTRSVMAFLDIDGTYSTGSIRLVVARSLGLKDSRYRYLIFNNSATEGDDSSLWSAGDDYNFVMVRDGDDLRVHVHDITNDTWHDFTGGECVGFFADYDFPHNKRDFRVGNVAFRKTGSSGDHFEGIADLPASGYSGGTYGYIDYGTGAGGRQVERLGWFDRTGRFYHARAWSRAWQEATIHAESGKRFAAFDSSEPMFDRVKSDIGFFNEDQSANENKFYDRASSQFWRAYKADTDTTGIKNPKQAQIQNVQRQPDIFDACIITDDGVASLAEVQYRLSASAIGNGSIVLTTNNGSYTLSTRQWNPAASTAYHRPLSDANIDPQQFNWFTSAVTLTDNSGDFDLGVLDLYVNGNKMFDAALGEYETPIELGTQDLIVYLGGNPTLSNDGDVQIGEFRFWSKNRYDDPTEDFDYLTSRIRASELPDLYFYATFEPADEVTATTYNHSGSLSSDLLTLVNGASIEDTRAGDTSGASDPAPAIGIPEPPYDHITAVELFRTQGYPIEDTEDEGEIQRALDAVRGQPLYFLARVPAGDPSYVDIVGDDALGYESPEPGTGSFPEAVNGIALWQNQLCVWRGNDLWFAEPGPFGWDSYPAWLRYPVPVDKSGSDIAAAAEVQGALLVCGQDWATLLTGAPSNPQAMPLGASPGVQSSQCLVANGGSAYGLGDGKLWRMAGGEVDESFGLPVQDLIPTSGGKLAVSADLSSLLVIGSSEVLRYHFPTQRWSVEERDATAAGDVNGTLNVVHGSGAYSTASSTVYGDDVTTSTAVCVQGTVAGTSTISIASNPNVPVGARVLIVDENGNAVVARAVSYA